ncbi:MAG: copper resistance CopC family protein [Nocardioidaceae bacterium]
MSLRLPAVAAIALCGVLLAVGTMPQASAHATLVSSDPKDGSSLKAEPTTTTITFSEDVATPAQLQVTAPDGTELAEGEPTVDGTTVSQPLLTSGQSGRYTLAYRVVSADGHPVSGELTYNVSRGEQTEAATSSEDRSFVERHATHLVLGAAAVLVAATLLLWPWIRRRA